MDADTRHQLKQNELVEALGKLRGLKDDPKTFYTLIAVAVVIVAVVVWLGWRYSREHALQQGWQRLATISTGLAVGDETQVAGAEQDLRAMIAEASDPGLAGYARLRLARSRVDRAMAQPEGREAALQEARDLLEQIRSDPATRPMLDAAAAFLLATTCESLREIDRAREVYESLTQDTRYAGSPYVELARWRLEDIDTLTVRVAFAPGHPPQPEPVEAAEPPGFPIRKMTPEEAARAEAAIRGEAPAPDEPAPEQPPQPEPDGPQPSTNESQ